MGKFPISNFTLVPTLPRGNAYHLHHSPQTGNLQITRSSPVCGLQTGTLRPTQVPFPRRSMGTRGSWKIEIRNWATHQNYCVRANFQFPVSNFCPRSHAPAWERIPPAPLTTNRQFTAHLPLSSVTGINGNPGPTRAPFPRRSMGTRGSWKLEIRNWPTHQNDCVRANFQFQISNFSPSFPRSRVGMNTTCTTHHKPAIYSSPAPLLYADCKRKPCVPPKYRSHAGAWEREEK